MRVTFQNAVAHAVPCWPAASLSPALKRCPCAAWATPACRTRRRCRQLMQRPDGSHAALALWAAGGLAGAVSWFSVYPFDVLKTRLQAGAAASSPYKGGPAGQLHACGGRRWQVSKVASIVLVGIWEQGAPKRFQTRVPRHNYLCTISLLQAFHSLLLRLSTAGWVDCARQSYATEGTTPFFRGLSTTLGRAFLVNGAIFTAYELSHKLLSS